MPHRKSLLRSGRILCSCDREFTWSRLRARCRNACHGRALSDSKSSINYFHFSVFSAIWGICFSLKLTPIGFRDTFGTGDSPALYQFVRQPQRLPTVGTVAVHGRQSIRPCPGFIGIGVQSYPTSKRGVRGLWPLSQNSYAILNLTCHDYSMSCLRRRR
jgi:hypothetical protein